MKGLGAGTGSSLCLGMDGILQCREVTMGILDFNRDERLYMGIQIARERINDPDPTRENSPEDILKYLVEALRLSEIDAELALLCGAE